MRYDPRDTFVSDALGIVAKYDPALYGRIVACDMTITSSFVVAMNQGMMSGPADIAVALGAFGATVPAVSSADHTPRILINARDVQEWAERYDVPTPLFAAAIVAHEFQHVLDNADEYTNDEPQAFTAGGQFALKLPQPYGARIKRLSDQTLASYA